MEIAKREMTMEEIISSLDIDSMQKERLLKGLARRDDERRCAAMAKQDAQEYEFRKAHENYERIKEENRALKKACYALSDALSRCEE